MTTFNEREKSFEKKFAMDEELKFKAESRRNRLLGQWAAAKLGLSGAAVDDYVKAVRKADLAEKGDDDVFRKIKKDLEDKGVGVPDSELRKAMVEFLATAVHQIEGDGQEQALIARRQLVASRGSARLTWPSRLITCLKRTHRNAAAGPRRGTWHPSRAWPSGPASRPSIRSGQTCVRKPRRPCATSRRSAASSMRPS